jgi:SAM-dependent methyltransferase
MEELGVGPGWRCLEIGAGHGSIACWLAERVASTGHVVATDIDLRFLERIQIPNLEIRRHDICENDFEPNAYDLVHCRALLVHVPKAEEALTQMGKTVRPGGWLFVEEPDYRSFGSVDSTYPGAEEFDCSVRVITEVVQAAEIMRTNFGRRLLGLMERLGFKNIGYNGTVELGRGGGPLSRFYSRTIRVQGVREQLIDLGVQTREQLDHVLHMYDDPSFEFVGPTHFSVWAQHP